MITNDDGLTIPTLDDMLEAHERIKPYIHRTPVLTSRFLNELAGCEMFLSVKTFKKRVLLKFVVLQTPYLA